MKRTFSLALLCLLGMHVAFSQTWEWVNQLANPVGHWEARASALAPNGDLILSGWYSDGPLSYDGQTVYPAGVTFPFASIDSSSEGVFIARFTPDGDLAWLKTHATVAGYPGVSVGMETTVGSNGEIYWAINNASWLYFSDLDTVVMPWCIARLDGQGDYINHIEPQTASPIDSLTGIATDAQGNVYVSILAFDPLNMSVPAPPLSGSGFPPHAYVVKMDQALVIQDIALVEGASPFGLDVSDQGKVWMVAQAFQPPLLDGVPIPNPNNHTMYAIQWNTDFTGAAALPFDSPYIFQRIVAGPNGEAYLAGRVPGPWTIAGQQVNPTGAPGIGVMRIDANLTEAWGQHIQTGVGFPPGSFQRTGLTVGAGGTILVSDIYNQNVSFGNESVQAADPADFWFTAKMDANGNLDWLANGGGNILEVQNSQQYYVAGRTDQSLRLGPVDFVPITGSIEAASFVGARTDGAPVSLPNRIEGMVYADEDLDCELDSLERGLGGWLIQATPGPYYAVTQPDGSYSLPIDSGSYMVEQLIPNIQLSLVTPVCPIIAHSVQFDSLNQTIGERDFANEITLCENLTISVDNTIRRRCFRGRTTIDYRNIGFEGVSDRTIRLQLPGATVLLDANRPYTFNDPFYEFVIDTIPPGGSGRIIIEDSIRCGAIESLGLTICTQAAIENVSCFPPDPQWSGVTLTAEAECLGNIAALFHIINATADDMLDSADYQLLADGALVATGRVKLDAGDSLSFQVPAYGYSWRLEVDQPNAHPTGAQAIAVLDNCGSASLTGNTLNPVPGGPSYDTELIYTFSEVCDVIVGSFDPNDKQVNPAGYTEDGIVRPGTYFTYRIRFQNTGNDTAFKVVVVDTLSEFFDYANFYFQGASHDYTYTLEGRERPVLTVTFDPIILPDSATNPAGSQGYFSFSVGHLEGLPLGTRIENAADIYFDFNDPIRTNTAVSTIDTLAITPPGPLTVQNCTEFTVSPLPMGGEDIEVCANGLFEVSLQASSDNSNYVSGWASNSSDIGFSDIYDPMSEVSLEQTGSYEVYWTLAGCEQPLRDTVLITGRQVPDAPQVALVNLGLTLVASPGFDDYRWFRDGQELAGETNDSLNVFVTGDYQAQVFDAAEGCWSPLSLVYRYDIGTGLPSFPVAQTGIKVYPTLLAKGESLRIKSYSAEYQEATLELISLEGKRLDQSKALLKPGEETLWQPVFPHQGVYLLKIQLEEHRFIQKVIMR